MSIQLSLRELSPIRDIPEGHLLVVFKSFFDGGNQADERLYSILTLAALSGTEAEWRTFDKEWKKVLLKQQPGKFKYLHTTDAVGLTGEFSKDNGWTRIKVDKLIGEFVGVIERCSLVRGHSRTILKPGLRPTTISVLLRDLREARKKMPDLNADNICATQCVASCCTYGKYIGAKHFELYFDQGESFLSHIHDRLHNRKSLKRNKFWEAIIHLGESNSRHVPALQAADLLAWSVNDAHKQNDIRFDWQERLLAVDRDKEWYGYSELLNVDREDMELLRSWKLPKKRNAPSDS